MTDAAFLLVHGSWHGPWCWDRLVPLLEARGHVVRTVQLPSCTPELGGPEADWAAVAEAAAGLDGPVVAVGHSYGGIVITAAEWPANVERLVYVGAFMPDEGQSLFDLLPGQLPPYVAPGPDGTLRTVDAVVVESFYNTCTPEDAEAARARLVPQIAAVASRPAPRANWRSIPSSYIVLTLDHALPPEIQRRFADQVGESFEMETDHSPFLCQPEALAGLLGRIAAAPVAA